MKVFVWQEVDKCSGNYHAQGGVVVFAETEERARELARVHDKCCQIAPNEMPDEVREVAGGEEAVYIMPNAGCC
jgi:hypothetical protein